LGFLEEHDLGIGDRIAAVGGDDAAKRSTGGETEDEMGGVEVRIRIVAGNDGGAEVSVLIVSGGGVAALGSGQLIFGGGQAVDREMTVASGLG
jgi:hypothetical protein